MKSKLIVFILSAVILGGSNAALARGKGDRRNDEPRVQHSQQRDWGQSRHRARGHHDTHRDRQAHRRMDRHPRHDRGWSRHHPRKLHGRSRHHQYRGHAHRRHHYPAHRSHAPARSNDHPESSLSIILHGHF
jgi:hypothetical protein